MTSQFSSPRTAWLVSQLTDLCPRLHHLPGGRFEQEAGAIFIDKKYHLDALLLSQKMLEDWKFWFNFSDGDKDVFRFAFLALRKRWGVPGRFVGQAALPSGTASGAFCGLTMQVRPSPTSSRARRFLPEGLEKLTCFAFNRSNTTILAIRCSFTTLVSPFATRQPLLLKASLIDSFSRFLDHRTSSSKSPQASDAGSRGVAQNVRLTILFTPSRNTDHRLFLQNYPSSSPHTASSKPTRRV